MRIIIPIIALFLWALSIEAQILSQQGYFEVDKVRGCAPFTVTITNATLRAACVPCSMNYDFAGSGVAQANQTTYTYNIPGTYVLKVQYGSSGGGGDTISITVDDNVQPNFNLFTCLANKVSLKITDKTYDSYFINFDDGSPEVQLLSSNNQTYQYSYASSGNRNIRVRGKKNGAADNCTAKQQVFTATSTVPAPTITTLTAVDASTVQLDFVPNPNTQYKLEMAVNAGGFVQLQNVHSVQSIIVPGLDLDNNFYCFRMSPNDLCTFQNNYSPIICSHDVELTLANNNNQLDWKTTLVSHAIHDFVTTIEINRNGQTYVTLPPGNTYSDTGGICNTNYCYQLVSHYNWGGKSLSLTKCGKSISLTNPPPITNISANVDEKSVTLTWTQPTTANIKEFSVFKSQTPQAFTHIHNSSTTQYVDPTYTSSNTCYKINYLDNCLNNSADSAPICPIVLRGTVNDKNEVTLNWSDFTGWTSGINKYMLEKFDAEGNLMETITKGIDLVFTENKADLQNQAVFYRIIASPNGTGILPSISNRIQLVKKTRLFYPTAFTPDGKGPMANETFTIEGQFITKIELSIFDRWGKLIFFTDTGESWDGLQAGSPLATGTYVWKATIVDKMDKAHHHAGTILLLRK